MAPMNLQALVRLSRRPVTWAALLLGLFHLGLLGQRIADGTLLQPVVLARWLAGLALVWALVRTRRSLTAGRSGALWALVLLLHLVAGLPAVDVAANATELVLPLGLLAAAGVLCAGSARLGGGVAEGLRAAGAGSPTSRPLRLSTVFLRLAAPRGPPLRS